MAPPAPPSAPRAAPHAGRPRRLHPLSVRVMHWVNAGAVLVMIGSGLGIYDDDVIVSGLHFPAWLRLGSWAPQSLLWHFAFMWVLALNGLAYLAYGFVTGRFRERFLPIRLAGLRSTLRGVLRLRLAHEDLRTYNAVQKLLYVLVIAALAGQVVTGLAIWKPVQFSGLVSLLGGFQAARLLHFAGMAFTALFLLVHVTLAVLVPRTLWAMLAGGPRLGARRT